jgi:hypothetical protein
MWGCHIKLDMFNQPIVGLTPPDTVLELMPLAASKMVTILRAESGASALRF